MKNYWILTRVMLKNMLASMNPMAGAYTDGKKKRRAVFRAAGVLILILLALGTIISLEYLIYSGLDMIRMPMVLPGMAIFLSMVLTLVLGLFQSLSELFQGKDAPFLAVLPLTSRTVFAARLTTLYLSELVIDAVLCLPAFVLYSIGRQSALPVLLTGLPTLILLPVLPLSAVALIAYLLMRVSVFARHRESIVMALSMLVAIAYSIGVTLMNQQDGNPAAYAVMLASQNGLLEKLLGAFPPALWATKGLIGDAVMLLLFAAVSLAAAALVILAAGPGYLEQALSSTERTVHRTRRTESFGWRKGSAFRALHGLEWKELLRTPAWAYNSLVGVIMFPLMIAIGFVAGFSKAGDSIESMRMLLGNVDPGYVALVTSGVIMLGSMVNPAVSTAISREGGRWPFALTLPVQQKVRFRAKLMVGMEINAVCMVMVAAVAWYLVRMPILWLLAALGVALMNGLAAAALSLWVDAKRPQLNWTTEMEAIKKNFNQVIGMMLWVVLIGLCAAAAVLLWSRGGGAALAGAAGVAAVEMIAAFALLHKVTEKHLVLQV